jgi:hypothetical protein
MKKIWMIIALAMMITFTCEGVYAQAKPLTRWVSVDKTVKTWCFDTTTITDVSFQYVNMTIWNKNTDTIYVAKDMVDTAATMYVPVPPNYQKSFWGTFKKIRVKARSGTGTYQLDAQ